MYTSAFAQSRDLKSSGATGGERKRTQATSGGERRKNVTQGLKALERGRETGSGKGSVTTEVQRQRERGGSRAGDGERLARDARVKTGERPSLNQAETLSNARATTRETSSAPTALAERSAT